MYYFFLSYNLIFIKLKIENNELKLHLEEIKMKNNKLEKEK